MATNFGILDLLKLVSGNPQFQNMGLLNTASVPKLPIGVTAGADVPQYQPPVIPAPNDQQALADNIAQTKAAVLAQAPQQGAGQDYSSMPSSPSMDATAMQPPTASPTGGVMDFLKSDTGLGLMSGLSNALGAKLKNKNDTMVDAFSTGVQNYKKTAAQNAFSNQVNQDNLTPTQKAYINMAVQSGDPKLLDTASKMLFANQTAKPTTLMQNLEAAGFKPGTPEYVDAMNKSLFKTGQSRSVGLNALNSFKDQLATDSKLYGYGWDANKTEIAAGRYLKGYSTFPDGSPLPDLSGEAEQLANQTLKAGTNSAGITQQRSAAMVDKILKEGAKQIGNAAKYASVAGQGALLKDRIKAGFGKGTPEYQDYIKFTRVTVPAAVNAAIKAEGANMSDDSKKLLINSLNPIAFDSDFDTAMEQYKYFQQLYGNVISPLTTEGQVGIKQGIRNNDVSNNQVASPMQITPAHLTEANIQATMQATGLPRDQVLAKLQERMAK